MQKRCLKCNKVVPAGRGYKSAQKYCSAKCYQWRNLPPKEDILEHLNRNANVTVTANLFGVNKQALYRWMKHYGIRKKVVYA